MSLKILALKENPAHGQALAASIEAMGHQIKVVTSKKEALQQLYESEYDVLLSALHFETDSAFELLRIVKARDSLREKPFVFCCIRPSKMTRTMSEAMEVAALALGADALILVDEYGDPRIATILSDLEKRLAIQNAGGGR
jgi:CheY-like chemotaxis protein